MFGHFWFHKISTQTWMDLKIFFQNGHIRKILAYTLIVCDVIYSTKIIQPAKIKFNLNMIESTNYKTTNKQIDRIE